VRFVLTAAVVVAGLLVPAASSASGTLTATLKDVPYVGEFGPGYKLVFQLTSNNRPVKHLPVGTYTLVVDDRSRILNFHLTRANGTDVRSVGPGGGTRIITGVERKERRTFTVRLTRGTYVAYSDPHASAIRKTFRVG
jgi:hypothetical protein